MSQVVGFTADADIYCPECAARLYGPDTLARRDREGNGVYAVFADSEWDSPQYCHACCRFLLVRLTRAGYDYVRERGPRVPEEWRRAYPAAFARRR